jgi:hypothetical protein
VAQVVPAKTLYTGAVERLVPSLRADLAHLIALVGQHVHRVLPCCRVTISSAATLNEGSRRHFPVFPKIGIRAIDSRVSKQRPVSLPVAATVEAIEAHKAPVA